VPSGISGTVIDVQVFTREGIERDKRSQSIIEDELKRYKTDLADQMRIVESDTFERLERLLTNKTATAAQAPCQRRQGHQGLTSPAWSATTGSTFAWRMKRPRRRSRAEGVARAEAARVRRHVRSQRRN